jgi:hypothetical protein
MKNYLTLQAFDDGAYLTGTISFFEICLHSFSKNTTIRKSILLPSSSNEERKPVDTL